jgi:nucleotide-binding universal stress UspA family protein
MNDPLVLGYDESPSANAALKAAIALAAELKTSVVVVFGYYISPLGGTGGGTLREALERMGEHALQRALSELEAAGITAETRLLGQRPADAILEVARDVGARMIIVGTVGENPISGAILGSVVLRLVQRSTLPLLVIPTDDT